MYLNVYVPQLQALEGTLKFIRIHHGFKVSSAQMVEPIARQSRAQLSGDCLREGTTQGRLCQTATLDVPEGRSAMNKGFTARAKMALFIRVS
jgi:hypothetical protein